MYHLAGGTIGWYNEFLKSHIVNFKNSTCGQGGNRTHMEFYAPRDFESRASTVPPPGQAEQIYFISERLD